MASSCGLYLKDSCNYRATLLLLFIYLFYYKKSTAIIIKVQKF